MANKKFYALWDAIIDKGYILPGPSDIVAKLEEYTKYDLIEFEVELERVVKNDNYVLYLLKEKDRALNSDEKRLFNQFSNKIEKVVKSILEKNGK